MKDYCVFCIKNIKDIIKNNVKRVSYEVIWFLLRLMVIIITEDTLSLKERNV